MHIFRKCIVPTAFIILFLLSTPSTTAANDFVFTINPNPVIAGQSVKLIVISQTPLNQAKFRLDNGTVIFLNRINNKVYKKTWSVPNDYEGKYPSELVIVFQEGEKIILPDTLQVVKETSSSIQLDTRTSDISQLDNNTELNIQIDELETEVSLLESEKESLRKKILELEKLINASKDQKKSKSQEKELEKQAKRLRDMELDFKNKELKMKSQLDLLSQKMSTLNDKQRSLIEKETYLSDIEKELKQKTEQLESKEKRIKKQEQIFTNEKKSIQEMREEVTTQQAYVDTKLSKLEKENKALEKKSKHIDKKTVSLQQLESQINTEALELESRKVALTEIQKNISKEQKAVENEKNDITREKNEVQQLKTKLDYEKSQIKELSKTLQSQSQALDDEKKRIKLKDSSLSKAYQERELLLSKQEAQLETSQKRVSEMESEYDIKQKSLEKNLQSLKKRESSLSEKIDTFESVVSNVVQLEQDLYLKYKSLNALQDHSATQLNEIREESDKLSIGTERYISQLDLKMKEMSELNALMEKRMYQMNELNKSLKRQNTDYEKKVNELLSYDSFYAFTSFIKMNNVENPSISSKEFGTAFSTFLVPRLMLRLGLSFTSRVNQINARSQNQQGLNGYLQSHFILNPGYPIQAHLLFGGTGGLGLEQELSKFWGGELSFLFKNNIQVYFDAVKSEEWGVVLGIGKFVSMPKRKRSSTTIAPDAQRAPINVVLKTPDNRPIFESYNFQFNDIDNHWSKASIKNISKWGILGSKYQNQFFPNTPLTKLEMANSLVMSYYIDDLVNIPETKIEYSIIANPTQEFFIDLHVLNRSGEVVRTLVNNQSVYKGDYGQLWDGKDDKGNRLSPGEYTVEISVFTQELQQKGDKNEYDFVKTLIKKQNRNIQITTFNLPTIKLNRRLIQFEDLKENSDPQIIAKAIELDLVTPFTPVDTYSDTFYFQPNATITRIQFIESIGKLLILMGANQNRALIDFSIYKDSNLLSSNSKKLLSIYVSELGYGGNANATLDPNRLVTRAEAATILNRLYNWKFSTQSL